MGCEGKKRSGKSQMAAKETKEIAAKKTAANSIAAGRRAQKFAHETIQHVIKLKKYDSKN